MSAYPKISADNKKGMNCINGVFLGFVAIPIQETPKIRAILEMFDPTTAPIAKGSLWLSMDEIPTNISGADVPSATTVRPIVSSLIPNCLAIIEELSTNLSAPHIKTISDRPNRRRFIKKSINYFTSVINEINYVCLIYNRI